MANLLYVFGAVMLALGVMLALECLAAQYVAPLRRVGGLTFWRIGRLGGSFYIRNPR